MIRDGGWSSAFDRAERIAARVGGTRACTLVRGVARALGVVPSLPTWAQIEVTNRCNFSCSMCPRKAYRLPEEDMPLERFQALLTKLTLPPGSLITLFGLGEPLLHPQILAMVQMAKVRGFQAAFTTNGTLLGGPMDDQILQSGLDFLRISVDDDGFGDLDGSLHRAARAVIAKTRAFLVRRGSSRRPEVMWNVVASAASAPSVPRLIRLAAHIGLDGVNIINLVPRFSSLEPLPEDRRAWLFKEWHLLGRELGIRVQSTFADRFGPQRFFYSSGQECPQLFGYVYVTMDGDITPCCHLPRLSMGNLFSETLAQIWNGPRFRAFRRRYRTEDPCKGCRLLSWR